MCPKKIKDRNLPAGWEKIITTEHKYIVIPNSYSGKNHCNVYHCDDCTFNNLFIIGSVRDFNEALSFINNFENQNPS